MNTKVSIIVPCYNQAQYLDEALQSVLNQTYVNWECVIVNDGSSDNTDEIAQRWVASDKRFIYLHQENTGVSSARNLGISFSSGTFILPLDADDKISIDYVALAARAFNEDISLMVVYSRAEKFGDEIGVWNLDSFALLNFAHSNMIFCSAMYRKKDWEAVGGYDENMVDGLEDWEFWIALLKNGGTVKCLDTVGFYYRIKEVSRQKKINSDKRKILFDYLCRKHYFFFIEHVGSSLYLKECLANAENTILKNKEESKEQLQSKKFVLNLFCKTFFRFSIFDRYN